MNRPAFCSSCNASIRWVRTISGKRMPLDYDSGRWLEIDEDHPGPDRGVMASGQTPGGVISGHWAAADIAAALDGMRGEVEQSPLGYVVLGNAYPPEWWGRTFLVVYTSHFATCPNAAAHRKRR